jgi:hypothetical protein
MRVDRAWVERNLGFNPIETPAPVESFAALKASKPKSEPEDLQRDIIEFDSAGPAGTAFLAFTTATGLSRLSEIPWPKGLEPITDKTVRKGTAVRKVESELSALMVKPDAARLDKLLADDFLQNNQFGISINKAQ